MVEQLEDCSFKRITDRFPIPMLKYLRVQHDTVKPYNTKIEMDDNSRQFLDYVIQIFDDKLFDLEFHSTVLTMIHLGRYGTYKINLRIDSKKFVYQCILCTADPKLSKRELFINEDEKIKLNIVFTLEDDADEKIEILEDLINNNKKLTSTDIEIIYLTVTLYMKSSLTKSELLLKISELTNQVEGLTDEEIFEIKLFQRAFLNKFISDDDEFKGEIEKMISINDADAMREMFPEGFKEVMEKGLKKGLKKGIEEGIEEGIIQTAKNMKELGDNILDISKRTGLSVEEIEKL